MRSKALITLTLLVLPVQAQAPAHRTKPTAQSHAVPPGTADTWVFENGNALYEQCSGNNSTTSLQCMAYIRGAVDLIGELQGLKTLNAAGELIPMWNMRYICIPTEATTGQVTDVVRKYLEDHPEQRTDDSSILIIRALEAAWHCPEKE